VILGVLYGHLEYDGQALLDRAGDPGGHLWSRVPVVCAHRAASALATAAAGLVARQLVNDPGGDAGILQPGREGMAEIVSAM
jgi:hypothetical protein